MQRARDGDKTVAVTLAKAGGGLGGARVRGKNMPFEELEKLLGKYMTKKVRRAWSEKDRGPGVSGKGDLVVAGLQLGNVWLFVQPLLGVEGYVGLDDDEMNRSKSPITITHLFCPYPVSQ
jgi:magnesium chelatase subunit H